MRITPTKTRRVVALTLAAVLAVSLAGCGKREERKPPTVTSAWPRADAERIVPKPPEPPRWPLTGIKAPDYRKVKRRVLSVKVENSPAARPQSGLNSADVVYESLAEGGITRFNALFHSQDPALVGPVRSARLSDSWIVPQYDALFFFSGASDFVTRALRQADIPMLSEDAGVTRCYTRSSERRMPHNLYLKAGLAREEGVRRGYPATQALRPFAFQRRLEDSTATATSIEIPFSGSQRTTWTYDQSENVYLRENNGDPHEDAASGEQVRASNVVVMWTRMRTAGARDVAGNPTYDITLGGSGRASVFHDGKRWDGTWEAGNAAPPVFKGKDGKPIRLAAGNLWLEVIPASTNITFQ